jgi:hypothetical protein
MGLDMFLDVEVFFWTDTSKVQEKIRKALGIKTILDKRIKRVIIEGIYWRKANAIHKWFVNKVQNGKDDCGQYEVSHETLKELLGIIDRVLKDHGLAEVDLPTEDGFFFGSTEYNKGYFENLKYTKKQLEEHLQMYDQKIDNVSISFIYHSSW